MRYPLIALLFVSTVLMASAKQDPSTPQGHPVPYPNGKFCTPEGDRIGNRQTKDHPCACKRHDQIEADDPEAKDKHAMCKAGEATNPSHDTKCLQECSEQHCGCPVECDVKGHGKPSGSSSAEPTRTAPSATSPSTK